MERRIWHFGKNLVEFTKLLSRNFSTPTSHLTIWSTFEMKPNHLCKFLSYQFSLTLCDFVPHFNATMISITLMISHGKHQILNLIVFLSRLKHPNLALVFGSGIKDSKYVVSQYIDGCSLFGFLRNPITSVDVNKFFKSDPDFFLR
jgi:hypothetical protein